MAEIETQNTSGEGWGEKPSVGKRIGSPHFVEATRNEIISVIGRACARDDIHVDGNGVVSMTHDRWMRLKPAIDAELERSMTIVADEVLRRAALAAPAAKGGTEVPADPLVAYLERQWSWSKETFGPALRTKGIVQHITKELREIEADPHDLAEWVDVIILAMDGFWRHGGKPSDLLPAMQAKQDRNFARTWPDWRTMGEDQAIEHDRSGEVAPLQPARAAVSGSGDLISRSDVLAICEQIASTAVDYIFSGAEPDHNRRREAMEATATSIRHAVANLSAPTPDLGAQGEPVAWAWEAYFDGYGWLSFIESVRPDADSTRRNIRPLYEAPAAPRSGSGVTVTKEQIASEVGRVLVECGPGMAIGVGVFDKVAGAILALIQAPRPGETGDGWEPIETAPKEAKYYPVQICGGSLEGTGVAWWRGELGNATMWHRMAVPPAQPAPSQPHPAAQAGDGGGANG